MCHDTIKKMRQGLERWLSPYRLDSQPKRQANERKSTRKNACVPVAVNASWGNFSVCKGAESVFWDVVPAVVSSQNLLDHPCSCELSSQL